ncbi:caspase family protein [Dinghuibacter silviterrae]|uniref:Caspase domain-containing protein n=1 Tax=Dinghuibacter silviterrae TaxID=1539049 RepID=A0A4V3GKV6_9BACT|nr:caspase family protein [Dinghuibacter silviterrae]TDW97122.1 caspase domain-containing protein [Dinghuibacter silviterrae]
MTAEKTNALALVIGVNDYQHTTKLKAAVKDATDVADKLMSLGFTVMRCFEPTNQALQNAIMQFGGDLPNYTYGLFYFAGHAMQLDDGHNYLMGVDTHVARPPDVQSTAIKLAALLNYLQWAKNEVNIVILDACRDNPFPSWARTSQERGLAAVNAPKGTLIAFSTSPGERASDIGPHGNGLYTSCLLKHIGDQNIPVEEFFKRVRTSLYVLSKGTQTSWEHTSLIGQFFFNSGKLIHAGTLPYAADMIADGQYQPDDSEFGQIITQLKSYNFDTQNIGVRSFAHMPPATFSDDEQFLFGRNLLQTACGGSYPAKDKFEKLGPWLKNYTNNGQNHMLNGMLFEIYFNSKGQFRQENFKIGFITEIFALRSDPAFGDAFTFIVDQLQPFRDYLYYLPSVPIKTLAVELSFDPEEVEFFGSSRSTHHRLTSVRMEGMELLEFKTIGKLDGVLERKQSFLDTLEAKFCVPASLLRLTSNPDLDEIKTIVMPYPLTLKKPR